MNTITITINNEPITFVSLGVVEFHEAPQGYFEKHIVYAQNRLAYCSINYNYEYDEESNTYNKTVESADCTNMETISEYVVIPELDKLINN